MDNQPAADPHNQQNAQPTRRLFVYDRPHAAKRPSTRFINNDVAPVRPATVTHSQPVQPSQTYTDPKLVEPEPTQSAPKPSTVPVTSPQQPDLSRVQPRPVVKAQLPEHNFDHPDLVDLKPVWQVGLPDELAEPEQVINQPTQPSTVKKRPWQKAQVDVEPQAPKPQPNPEVVAPPEPTPIPEPVFKPVPMPEPNQIPTQPQPKPAPANPVSPIASPVPQPQQTTPQPIAPALPPKSVPTQASQNLVAKIPQQNNFNSQFAPNPKPKKSKLTKRVPSVMKLMAAIVLVAGAVVSFNAFQAKRQVNDQVANNPYKASDSNVLGSSDQSNNLPTTLSEAPLGDNLSMYRVEPGAPSKIIIPRLDLETRVFNVGVDSNNVVLAPDNINKIGWYESSAQPGKDGAVVLNGHVEGPTKRGALYGVEKLKKGDKITIERGDGVDFTYTVQATESYENDQIDMSKVSTPYVLGKKGLNIMTAGGRYNAETGQYELRYAVFATQNE